MSKATIVLKNGKEISLARRHPWVFSGAIRNIEGTVEEGDIVKVVDSKKNFLGVGHWQDGSIAVRILTFKDRSINANFWYERIKEATALRRQLRFPAAENNAFRLIFGEGDQLPGLVIDWYNGNAVVQSHSIGMHLNRNEISTALQKVFKDRLTSIYYKSSDTLPKSLEAKNEFLFGDCESCIVKEHGHQFEIDWINGQKPVFLSIKEKTDNCWHNTQRAK